jgi:hypothetical protein
MTANPLAGMTADQIGPLVAQAMKWGGPDIFAAMLEAVTDANFHTEAAALIRAWHEPQLTNAAPVLFNALQQLTEAATHHQADAPAALEAARSALKLATQTN